MFNFDSLNSIKKEAGKLGEKRNDKFEEAFKQALDTMQKFHLNPASGTKFLKEAAEQLINAMSQRRSRPEPYIVLSCIFYMINEDKLAVKYLKAASSLAPEMPQVKALKQLLGNISLTEVPKRGTGKLVSRQFQNIEKEKSLESSSRQKEIIETNNSNGPKRASPVRVRTIKKL